MKERDKLKKLELGLSEPGFDTAPLPTGRIYKIHNYSYFYINIYFQRNQERRYNYSVIFKLTVKMTENE